jgi:DNA polymerase I-like protein with 3'-5' exonuclease and polymerase domains
MNEIANIARHENNIFLHPRLNLHDDLTFLLPEDEVEEYVKFIHPILTRVRFPFQCVPLTVELAIGDNWAELDKIATFEGDFIR